MNVQDFVQNIQEAQKQLISEIQNTMLEEAIERTVATLGIPLTFDDTPQHPAKRKAAKKRRLHKAERMQRQTRLGWLPVKNKKVSKAVVKKVPYMGRLTIVEAQVNGGASRFCATDPVSGKRWENTRCRDLVRTLKKHGYEPA